MSSIVGKYLAPLFVQETPSGTVNGTNTTFTLSETPASASALVLTIDGVTTTLYTLTGSTITMNTAPTLGQILSATYVHA